MSNCLKALANQTFVNKDFELIVVSDGPDAATEKVIRQFRAEQTVDIFFYSLDEKKGPAAARNMGWKNSSAILIAFTDDDCLPDTNWLQSIWENYDGEELVAYSGKVTVPIAEKPTDYELNIAGLENAEFVTANCFCTRRSLIRTGGFDEEFEYAWREDSDLQFKLMLNNVPIHRNNKAVVVHPVREAGWGASLKDQRKTMYNALLYKKYPELYRSRIKPKPTWFYYIVTASFIITVFCCFASLFAAATVAFIVWLSLTIRFTIKRLAKTTKTPEHITEMFVTSMFIPILSIYWTLYGAWRYRVIFL